VLNRQDKLFAHLDEDYLRNILTVGGRYACGNADSAMPVWSNEGNPPGPLNYYEIDNLIAFIRAENTDEFRVMDPELFEPAVDEVTKQPLPPFRGWVDPDYLPEPGATPYPDCWADEFAAPAPSGSAGASADPGASQPTAGTVLEESAVDALAFVTKELAAPADAPFQIRFDNQNAGVPHNIAIRDANGQAVFTGEIFNGPDVRTYDVPALPAGSYTYFCSVHPNMTGTLTVGG
jgi:plastocyanin